MYSEIMEFNLCNLDNLIFDGSGKEIGFATIFLKVSAV